MSSLLTATDQQRAPRLTAGALVRLLRPHQWTKNLLCFAGVIFSGQFVHPFQFGLAFATFAVFCAASSAIYAFNDVVDRERDRRHPTKRNRPVASGAITPALASAVAFSLALAALAAAFFLGPLVLLVLGLYIINSLAYSLKFKHLALLDVLSIAIGFVLRLLGGVWALHDVQPTSWITLCTFFLATFLGAAKRRAELASAAAGAAAAGGEGAADSDSSRRPVLAKYSLPYLDALVSNAAVMAIMCYALFTVFKTPSLVVTVPIVFYGIMHYKRLVLLTGGGGEEPDRVLLKDRRIQLAILLWLVTFAAVMLLERRGIHLFEDTHRVGF